MGTAYTPGLKVSPFTKIETVRRLPIQGTVLCRVGDRVQPESVIARADLPGLMQTVRVSSQLGLEPADALKAIEVAIGDRVEVGQVIARATSFFGLFKSQCKSPCAGNVELINEVSGNVGIRAAPDPIELTAYTEGLVREVFPGLGAAIESRGAMIQGIFGVGGERHGPIRVLTERPGEPLATERLNAEFRGSVAVVGGRIAAGDVRHAVEAGAVAIVAGSILDRDLIEFLGHDIGVAITGQEAVPLTLIVTEGFGDLSMASRTFDLFRSLDGRAASVNGRTQIRAGVIRPEIVVPLVEPAVAPPPSEAESYDLEAGTPIRILRPPHLGALATVTELPPQLVRIETGADVRVLRARLSSGEQIEVPRANVEIVAG